MYVLMLRKSPFYYDCWIALINDVFKFQHSSINKIILACGEGFVVKLPWITLTKGQLNSYNLFYTGARAWARAGRVQIY